MAKKNWGPLEFDKTLFIRCDRCGVLKKRTRLSPLSPAQRECIIALREHTGFGYLKIARYLHMNHQTVQRVVRKYERYERTNQ